MDEQYADILQTCLEQIETGATVEECLAAFPAERAALDGPLHTAVRLSRQAWPDMPGDTRAAVQTRLRGQVAAYRTGVAPAAPAAEPPALHPSTPARADPLMLLGGLVRAVGYRGPLSEPALRLVAIGLGLVLALVIGAGALAAARAARDTARPTPSPAAVSAQEFTIQGPVQQLAPGSWVIAGMPVAVDVATAISGAPAVGAGAVVRGELRPDGTLLAREIVVTAAAAPAEPTALPTAAPAAAPAPAAPPPAGDDEGEGNGKEKDKDKEKENGRGNGNGKGKDK